MLPKRNGGKSDQWLHMAQRSMYMWRATCLDEGGTRGHSRKESHRSSILTHLRDPLPLRSLQFLFVSRCAVARHTRYYRITLATSRSSQWVAHAQQTLHHTYTYLCAFLARCCFRARFQQRVKRKSCQTLTCTFYSRRWSSLSVAAAYDSLYVGDRP